MFLICLSFSPSSFVNIYDLRHLKRRNSLAVCELKGHRRSVSSAFFSPHTGNRVLTTCMDNNIRCSETSSFANVPIEGARTSWLCVRIVLNRLCINFCMCFSFPLTTYSSKLNYIKQFTIKKSSKNCKCHLSSKQLILYGNALQFVIQMFY